MKIKKLEISNFLTIGKASLDLDDRGLLLIQGINEDDPSATSNGSGKSSVVDALCWALYGVTARDVSGDAVVNKTAKKNCHVGVIVGDGDKQYRINRYRKDATHKNQVFVHQHDFATGAEIDLSKGTDKETQEVIVKVLGCSLDVFMSSVYAGQERMPDLPRMTDKALKTLIEEAAGVEVLTEAYSIARQRMNDAQLKLESHQKDLAVAKNRLANLNSELAESVKRRDDFHASRRNRAKTELTKVLPLQVQMGKCDDDIASINVATNLKERLEEIEKLIASYSESKKRLDELYAAVRKAEDHERGLRLVANADKAVLDKLKKDLENAQALVGTPCKECGKTYCEDDLHSAVEARSKAIVDLRSNLKDQVESIKKAADAVTTLRNEATTFEAAMVDVSALAAEQRQIMTLLARAKELESKKVQIEKDIAVIKGRANAILAEENHWAEVVQRTERKIEAETKEVTNNEARVASADKTFGLMSDATRVFGPAGVRAHILDTVTPFLNDRTQEYLGVLADGNIHATWTTLTKSAKGELKEKFSIEVSNDKGAESFAGLSGGEKRKVRLATALALQDMVSGRATKPLQCFIGDEIDDAVDEAGLERLMLILERKAKERGTVLVISHRPLADWCDQVISVTKREGVSVVTGATDKSA